MTSLFGKSSNITEFETKQRSEVIPLTQKLILRTLPYLLKDDQTKILEFLSLCRRFFCGCEYYDRQSAFKLKDGKSELKESYKKIRSSQDDILALSQKGLNHYISNLARGKTRIALSELFELLMKSIHGIEKTQWDNLKKQFIAYLGEISSQEVETMIFERFIKDKGKALVSKLKSEYSENYKYVIIRCKLGHAKGIKHVDIGGSNDPFLKIKLKGEKGDDIMQKYKSLVHDNGGSTPQWKEEFEFWYFKKQHNEQKEEIGMDIEVKDYNRTKDYAIGATQLEIKTNEISPVWKDVELRIDTGGTLHFQIQTEIDYSPTIEQIICDPNDYKLKYSGELDDKEVLAKQVEKYQRQVETLQLEVQTKQEQYVASESKYNMLKQQLETLQVQLMDSQKLSSSSSSQNQEIKQLKQQLAESQVQQTSLLQRITQLDQDFKTKQQDLSSLQQQLLMKEQELATEKTAVQQFQKLQARFQYDLDIAKQQMATISQELGSTKHALTLCEQQLQTVNQDLLNTKKEKDELQLKLQTEEKQRIKAEQDIKTLQKQKSDLVEANNLKQEELQHVREDLNHSKHDYQNLKDDYDKFMKRICYFICCPRCCE